MSRTKGAKNLLGKSAKANIAAVFEKLGGVKAMQKWALSSPQAQAEFYRIYRALVPHEHTGEGGGPIKTMAVHDHFDGPVKPGA